MSEEVTLLGGPKDGMRMSIRHGDEISFAFLRQIPTLREQPDEPVLPLPIETIVYRRSLRNPSRFLFRPTQKDGLTGDR